MDGPPVVLVSESSATHSRPGEDQAHDKQAIPRSHFRMIKFGRRDQVYDIVLDLLLEMEKSSKAVVRSHFRKVDGKDDARGSKKDKFFVPRLMTNIFRLAT
jgi:hypothetical protein